MCDIYMPEDVGKMFENQHVLILGGSFMRGVYKDLVWLLNHASIIPREIIGAKSEKSFPDLKNVAWKGNGPTDPVLEKIFTEDNRDTLLETRGLTSGRTYIEPRLYYNKKYNLTVYYMFIVRVYTKELQEFLQDYESKHNAPISTIIMNSTLWDFNRWGPFGPAEFKINLRKLMSLLPNVLPPDGEFIWLTCPMGSEEINSKGMNVAGLEFQCFTSRYNVIEANFAASQIISQAGYGVVDIHFLLQMQTFRRNKDGIHWDSVSNRLVTNLILTHISLWRDGEEGLPGRVADNFALEMVKLRSKIAREGADSAPDVEDKLFELEQLPILQNFESSETELNKIKKDVFNHLSSIRSAKSQQSRRDEYTQAAEKQLQLPPSSLRRDVRYHPYGRDAEASHGYNAAAFNVGGPPSQSSYFKNDDVNFFDDDHPTNMLNFNSDGLRTCDVNVGGNSSSSRDMYLGGGFNDGLPSQMSAFGAGPLPPLESGFGSFETNSIVNPMLGLEFVASGNLNVEMMNDQLRERIFNYRTANGFLPSNQEVEAMKANIRMSVMNPMANMNFDQTSYMSNMNHFQAFYSGNYAQDMLRGAMPSTRFGRGGR